MRCDVDKCPNQSAGPVTISYLVRLSGGETDHAHVRPAELCPYHQECVRRRVLNAVEDESKEEAHASV